jgi:hypothetical protein
MGVCSSAHHVFAREYTHTSLSLYSTSNSSSLSYFTLPLPPNISLSLSLCSNLLSLQEAEDLLRDSEDKYARAKSQYERPSSSASVFRPVDYWVRLCDHLSFNFIYTCVGMSILVLGCCVRQCTQVPCNGVFVCGTRRDVLSTHAQTNARKHECAPVRVRTRARAHTHTWHTRAHTHTSGWRAREPAHDSDGTRRRAS